jgi:hypothetical protein
MWLIENWLNKLQCFVLKQKNGCGCRYEIMNIEETYYYNGPEKGKNRI